MGSRDRLFVACLAFLAVHLGLSGTPLRVLLRNSVGESLYLDVYSLFSCGSLGGIIYGYVQMAYVDFIWGPSVLANNVAKVFTLLALMTTLVGALVKNLTAVMSERALGHQVSGLLKITGHPVQLGGGAVRRRPPAG